MNESSWFLLRELSSCTCRTLQLYILLKGNLGNSKNKSTSLWNFVQNSEIRKLCYSISVVETCYWEGGCSGHDKLDSYRSTKLTVPPSSDNRLLVYHSIHKALSSARFHHISLLATADTYAVFARLITVGLVQVMITFLLCTCRKLTGFFH